ncbi:GIY-YIG nuclease family protein [Brevibacillus laterosporus]|uniref:GIY-YIG nuclease family protein n=1 Tax=Brevibacillus laterosporus TaxID=1465 RepID=UPI002655D2CD|nr:GIY-YIG nuclease family protein [Brevibacillus laterosporus]MDN9011938.1 GIY-YIG nuclease family protein [Brevibacillus laterosporus]MDO0943034.1 GIY-YIG nuclease family protein [Brevibacillus laterosporus]
MNYMKSIMENEIPSHKSHYVYILQCADGSLYTGYTTEIQRRLKQHRIGKGAKYTRGRCPIELVYWEEGADRSWGLKREEQIKRLQRSAKESLILFGNTSVQSTLMK